MVHYSPPLRTLICKSVWKSTVLSKIKMAHLIKLFINAEIYNRLKLTSDITTYTIFKCFGNRLTHDSVYMLSYS